MGIGAWSALAFRSSIKAGTTMFRKTCCFPRGQLGIGAYESHKGMDVHVEDDERRDPQSPGVAEKALDAQPLGTALHIADELFGKVGALTKFLLRQSTAFAELS
jgi:hypothetical protein